jgi:hypothetical protein
MRCADVTRELAVPSGRIDPAAIESHVANCLACAVEAKRAERFDRIWAATQPAEPSPGMWERVWSRVSQAAEAPATIPIASRRPARWSKWVAIAAVAQAAAVFGVAMIVFQQTRGATGTGTSRAVAVAQAFEFELEAGQTLFLELDERGDRVLCKPRFENTAELVALDEYDTSSGELMAGDLSDRISPTMWDIVLFNELESIAPTSKSLLARNGD